MPWALLLWFWFEYMDKQDRSDATLPHTATPPMTKFELLICILIGVSPVAFAWLFVYCITGIGAKIAAFCAYAILVGVCAYKL